MALRVIDISDMSDEELLLCAVEYNRRKDLKLHEAIKKRKEREIIVQCPSCSGSGKRDIMEGYERYENAGVCHQCSGKRTIVALRV